MELTALHAGMSASGNRVGRWGTALTSVSVGFVFGCARTKHIDGGMYGSSGAVHGCLGRALGCLYLSIFSLPFLLLQRGSPNYNIHPADPRSALGRMPFPVGERRAGEDVLLILHHGGPSLR